MQTEAMTMKYQFLFFFHEAILSRARWRDFFIDKCAERIRVLVVYEAHIVSMW